MTLPRRRLPSLRVRSRSLPLLAATAALLALATPAGAGTGHGDRATVTPIKHVIVIIGENRTFDHLFATYRPKAGQRVWNLLSEGIVTASGGPGPNAALARQRTASDTTVYRLSPKKTGPYTTLPRPDTTYAVGLPPFVPDTRFPADLPNRPYQITKFVPWPAYTGDPIHRFYQMWQQIDSGRNDLFVWTPNTAGDDNGAIPPAPIHQGGLQMGFYNMQQGDAPLTRQLADRFAISDNYHQAVMGGTGANSIVTGTADAAYLQDANGDPLVPPASQIENPNPKPGTNNNFTQDGYAGGSYSNCSDPSQPGVGPILDYLRAHHTRSDCAPGRYYLLNNYAPGYNADGSRNTSSPFTVSPQTFPTIGDALSARGISWAYFGQDFDKSVAHDPSSLYCSICNPFQYATSIMTTPLRGHLRDLADLQNDVARGTLPAVSYIKPNATFDGHPASSTWALFEQFTAGILNQLFAHPKLWASTAVLITTDEGGGYYDSGYVQPTSFFGDGTRIPLIVVSPYAKRGAVDHTYSDHNSILKFIERNWRLRPLSRRSLDNLPNPRTAAGNPYVPVNGPAVGDLFTLFDFDHPDFDATPVSAG
jgi:phospholipase C